MKKVIAAFMALVVGILLVSFANGVTDEESASASVTVNQFISITLVDAGSAGFSFGSLNPGIVNSNESAQVAGVSSITSAANVTNDAVSNVNANITLKGTDFTVDGNTLLISNVTYDDDGAVDQGAETLLAQANLTTAYPGVAYKVLAPDKSLALWFWLDVPSAQSAGSYTSTFSFRGSTS